MCSNGSKLYDDSKTALTGYLVPVSEGDGKIFPFPQLAQCSDLKEARPGSYLRAAKFYQATFGFKLLRYVGYSYSQGQPYQFNFLDYKTSLADFGPLVNWDFLNVARLKEHAYENLTEGGALVDPFNLTWPFPPDGPSSSGDGGDSGDGSGTPPSGGGSGVPPPPWDPWDPTPLELQYFVSTDYAWPSTTDSCVYEPYILLENKVVTIDQPDTPIFDLRGYVADMETPQCPQPPGAALIGDGYDYAAGTFVSGLGVIDEWSPDVMVNPPAEYFALLNDPEHKPRDTVGYYRGWDYSHAGEMAVDDEGSWSRIFSPDVSREQLLLWVRAAPGYSNGEYKIDVEDFWSMVSNALFGTAITTISTGWQPVPEDWDLETVTNALAELDTSSVLVNKVTLSLRSNNGLPTKAYFDYLTFQEPDDYTITIVDQSNPLIAECYLSYDPLPYPPGTPIDFAAPGIYVHCDNDYKYQLGKTNLTLNIENKLGQHWQDTFELTVEDTPPAIHGIDVISNTAQDITFSIVGWDDPDPGHGQNTLASQGVTTYFVEVFVNGNLAASYQSSDVVQDLFAHAGIPQGSILPGSLIEIRVTPSDGLNVGAAVATQFVVGNTPPLIMVFVSDSPNGEKPFGDVVSFTLTAYDAESQTLEYTLDYGDSSVSQGFIDSGTSLTLAHTYLNQSLPPFFNAVVAVSDTIDAAIATDIVVLNSTPLAVPPPPAPDPVTNLAAQKLYPGNDVRLTWDLPAVPIDAIEIFALPRVDAATDLGANSPDFFAGRLVAVLPPTATAYNYDATNDTEIYFKVATVAVQSTGSARALTETTVGKTTLILRKKDGYANWISLPLFEAHPDIEYAFNSLGRGYGTGHAFNPGVGICTGNVNDEYGGVVNTATHFDFFEYQRQISSGANEQAAVLAASLSYAPRLDCQYIRNPPFNLQNIYFLHGYDVEVVQDGSVLVVVGELIPDVSEQLVQTAPHTFRLGYSLPYEKNATEIFPDLSNGVELEYFDMDAYVQSRNAGQTQWNALSESLKSTLFPLGSSQYLATLGPGKGYRVIATKDTTVEMRHR